MEKKRVSKISHIIAALITQIPAFHFYYHYSFFYCQPQDTMHFELDEYLQLFNDLSG